MQTLQHKRHDPITTMTKTHKTTTRQRLFRTLALLSMICLSLSSCSPWDSELEEIYQSAQEGDRLSQFAIIKEYNSFKDIVPADTLDAYLWRFIKEGNHIAINMATDRDWKKFCKENPEKIENNSKEEYNKHLLKWYDEGIKYNAHRSYSNIANYYWNQYIDTRDPQDSIKSVEFYDKSIEAGNVNEMIRRDIKAGLGGGRVVSNAIKWGKFSYNNIFNEKAFPLRLALSFSYAYTYIISVIFKLLFTAAWWKVLLTFAIMFMILPVIIFLAKLLISLTMCLFIKREHRGIEMRGGNGTVCCGLIFGFWNHLCFVTAMSKNNLVWLNNINSMFLHESAYGIQPYFPLIMNWIGLICLGFIVYSIFVDAKKTKGGIKYAIGCSIKKFLLFFVGYLIAQVGGTLVIAILILVFMALTAVGTVKAAPKVISEVVSGTGDYLKKDENLLHSRVIRGCCSCMHWNTYTHYCDCYGQEKRTSDYDVCSNYVPK